MNHFFNDEDCGVVLETMQKIQIVSHTQAGYTAVVPDMQRKNRTSGHLHQEPPADAKQHHEVGQSRNLEVDHRRDNKNRKLTKQPRTDGNHNTFRIHLKPKKTTTRKGTLKWARDVRETKSKNA